MTTQRYLRRLTWLTNMIASRTEILDLERGRATNMVAPTDGDPVQTSAKDTMCEIMSKVVDMDKELEAYKAEFQFIMGQVNELTEAYASAYLFRLYVKDQSVMEIASEMKISRSTAYRVQRKAHEEFENMWGENYLHSKDFSFMEHFDTL